MKKFLIVLVALIIALTAVGCGYTEADVVNQNLSKEADYFNVERKITVYNARTDTIILEVVGYMSLSNNSSHELVVTCKTGDNAYKKNYIYLNDNVLYTVEDVSGTHADPYHYEFVFHTTIPIDIEVKK